MQFTFIHVKSDLYFSIKRKGTEQNFVSKIVYKYLFE